MELNEKIAKWLGVKKIYYEEWDTDKKYPQYIPSGKPWKTHSIDAKPLPNFTDSMDAILKWVVPKLIKEGFTIEITMDKITNTVNIWKISDTLEIIPERYTASYGHVSSLICLALEKYIDAQGLIYG